MRHRKRVTLLVLASLFTAGAASAQTDKPRFVILLDNSSSMTEDLSSPVVQTHGDGTPRHPGCDVDGKATAGWAYDDSKLYLAKSAVIDTISAFGAAEFALATYSRTLLGQPCASDAECAALVAGAVCVDVPGDADPQKYCAHHGFDSYQECSAGSSCARCANPADPNDLVFERGQSSTARRPSAALPKGASVGRSSWAFPSVGARTSPISTAG